MHCYKNNLVQAKHGNANEINEMTYICYEISVHHVKTSIFVKDNET
jgi:hypothetical protein